MSRVTISKRAAKALANYFDGHPRAWFSWAVDELRRALEPKRKSPDAAGMVLAADLKARANATRRAFGLAALVSKPRRPSKQEKRESRTEIWETCWKRCVGLCECGCGRSVIRSDDLPAGASLGQLAQLDHMFGRGKGRLPESVETCWILRADCHREKTNNRPDAATWWRKFANHCRAHMSISQRTLNAALARLAFVEVRAALPSSPRTGP